MAEAPGLAARRAALAALQAVDEDGTWSNRAVPAAIGDLAEVRDRGFAAHLAYETLRWEGTLDAALSLVCARPLAEVERPLHRVLRLGAVQLLISDVPDRAAVDTSVALAREQVPRGRAQGAGGFVNGVLRGLARRRHELPWPSVEDDPVAHLALTTGHPDWIVAELLERYDVERTRAILVADDVAPGVTLRAVGDRQGLIEELQAEGLEAVAGEVDEAVRVPGADPRQLEAVAAGRAVPQDEASMRVAHASGVRPGRSVLDLCAGPGGKTTHLARLAGAIRDGSAGRDADAPPVVAVELHPHRAQLVRDAAKRQGVAVDVRVGDATDAPLASEETFDVVLVDAPCTGLGTGRRRPEVRWRRTPGEMEDLAALQRSLLPAAAARVAPGGQLTYAVCTWTAAETERVADAFEAGDAARGFTPTGRRQLLPDHDDTDGMFIATWYRDGRDEDGVARSTR